MASPADRIAVITGASSGIGADAARALTRSGWHVVLVARSRDKLEDVASEIAQTGGKATVEALDAADGDAVLAMAERVRECGDVDLIVNCAGAGQWRFIEETTPAGARTMMDAPYFAAFNTTHAFMNDMLARRRGVIIHVGSPATITPWPGATGYTAARFALRGLHEALSQDLAGTGVRSCMVDFGEVSSEYFDNNPGSHEHLPRIARIVRVLTPEECADVILSVARRPRRRVIRPFMLWMIALYAWLMPPLVRWMIRTTGRTH